MPDADTVPPGNFSFSAAAEYAGTAQDRFHLTPLGLTFGFLNNLDVSASLLSRAPGDPDARGTPQNAQFSMKLRALTEATTRPALAFALRADRPFDGWDLSPSVIVHKNRGPLLVTGELGYRFPLRGGPGDPAATFYGLGVGYWLSPALNLMVQAVGEPGPDHRLWLAPGIAWSLLGPDPAEKLRESLRLKAKESVAALEAELGVKLDSLMEGGAPTAQPAETGPLFDSRTPTLGAPGRVTFFATGGPYFGVGPGWRVLAGIQISSFDEFLQDSDGDGIPDRIDQCPYEPEDWDGYQDEDGCPDHGGEILRKRAEERLRAAEVEAAKLTTPVPRFRLRIPLGDVPSAGMPGRDAAPKYQPMEPPPAAPAKATGPVKPGPSEQPAGPAKPTAAPAEPAAPVHPNPASSTAPARSARSREPRVDVAIVVMPPTGIVKRRAPVIGVTGTRTALEAEVDREIAAVAFADLAGEGQPVAGVDLDEIERVIQLAAEEGCEVLVWARARTPDLMPEAARVADRILDLAMRLGPIPAQQIATRVTTRPAATSDVELLVSALRDGLGLAPGAIPPVEPGRAGPELELGESGSPQLQRALVSHRRDLERCVAKSAIRLGARRAEAVVRVSVEPDGSATAAARRDSWLWSPATDACLRGAARRWHLPTTDTGYVADVPVAVISTGHATR